MNVTNIDRVTRALNKARIGVRKATSGDREQQVARPAEGHVMPALFQGLQAPGKDRDGSGGKMKGPLRRIEEIGLRMGRRGWVAQMSGGTMGIMGVVCCDARRAV